MPIVGVIFTIVLVVKKAIIIRGFPTFPNLFYGGVV
jgi:hypothetical protein